ncbi:ribonuclease M5 [Paenalkalicoccus suaedae]|uniref:Ribonuclease M5 n=1 Tax=Paenalkalicoccus suaedae TaxID=2592382 RepID=A0A859F983_9BACI|nr:ribonuclease M5 [Paenalkalicoccus suaedae]QKS69633.1 ribonuclease M5 [Paenalkalicoccus suaedae]
MQIHEMIVVEGKNDTNTLKRYFDCDTIETNGSAVSTQTIEKVRVAQERRGVIIFTDPDFPGQKIRQTIQDAVPHCKHAFLPKKQAIDERKHKVGIEHATREDLTRALQEAKLAQGDSFDAAITWEDLHQAGLVAGTGTKQKRERLGEELHIGYANGKQLLKRLHQFRISKEELHAALKRMEDQS